MRPHGSCAPKKSRRPDHEVADIFRAHGEAYRATHPLTPEQRKVMWCIEACRTEILGGHADVCEDCAHQEQSFNSCRNRHCPKCQALEQARWLARRMDRILPVTCFHLVFTLPSELRPLALRNRRVVYDLLFRSASQTLLELGRNPKRLGAQLGVTAVLHTWTRDLRFHPHLHCVATAGGLAPDGERWVHSDPKYLFPKKVISKLFRGKFLDELAKLHERGDLDLRGLTGPAGDMAKLRKKLFAKQWHTYVKRPFAGPEQVFAYLGRYTHRVAISNHRLLSVTDDAVTIETRDGKTATMRPHEFIRRFLLHVLPTGFVKIRHYGLLASSNVKTKLRAARQILEGSDHLDPDSGNDEQEALLDWRQLLEALTGIDLNVCPACGSTRLRRVRLPKTNGAAQQRARAPPPREER